MPPNGNNHISVQSLRGVRKVGLYVSFHLTLVLTRSPVKLAPSDWCNYAHGCRPDIVYALTDTPFTTPPYSQKRLTKSIGRSATWLLNLLTGLHRPADSDRPLDNPSIPGVFVHMAGSTSLPARRAFAESLKERLDGKDAEAVSSLGFKCLDDGVAGYIFDLVPLRLPLSAAQASKTDNSWNGLAETDLNLGLPSTSSPPEGELQEHLEQPPLDPQSNDNIVTSPSPLSSLVRASLIPLPVTKPRMINSATGPLELLRLIGEIGIDLFEVGWAVEAANVGVALDFQFPVPGHSKNTANGSAQVADEGRIVEFKVERANGDPVPKRIGHNLYEKAYTFDFSPLASCFNGAAAPGGLRNICPCAACSPIIPATRIAHDSVISSEEETKGGKAYPYKPAFTRAYIHHLLHTHEMSAHALLVMHNLSVVERFLEGVREVIGSERGSEGFWEEVERFEKVHPDEDREELMEEARKCWKEVDLARGRGRLKREKERQQEAEVVNE